MFSLLAIKACILPPAPLPELSPPSLMSHHLDCFLPSREDMKVILSDMEVLVARILCDYVKDLRQLKKFVVPHIPHTHGDKMAVKSDVLVLDKYGLGGPTLHGVLKWSVWQFIIVPHFFVPGQPIL